MHYDCLYTIKRFVRDYVDPLGKGRRLRILEVGSKNVNNPDENLVFRRYFDPNWEFIGLDIEDGKNVDVVSKEPYSYPFPDNYFDVVISGNTLEHVRDLHKIIKEIARLTSNLVCIIVPNYREFHEDPIDCWRVMPDGMRFLLEDVAGLEVLECGRVGGKKLTDTIGIAKKI